MLIRNAKEWQNNGCYWSWANGSGKVFKRPYKEGSPTINSLMIECGYAYDTEESVIEWLEKLLFDKLEIAPCEVLYFDDFEKIKYYRNSMDVYNYLDSKNSEIETVYLPRNKYLLRKDVSEQSLLEFGVKKLSILSMLAFVKAAYKFVSEYRGKKRDAK